MLGVFVSRTSIVVAFLLANLRELGLAERPPATDADRIDISFWGHFIAKRRGGGQLELEPGSPAAEVHPESSKVGAKLPFSALPMMAHTASSLMSLSEGTAVDTHDQSNRSVVSIESTPTHLVILPPENRSDAPKSALLEVSGGPLPGRNRDFKTHCDEGRDSQTGCESLCYRIMCTDEKFGSCDDFTQDIKRLSEGSWYPPDKKAEQGFQILWFKKRRYFGGRRKREEQLDFWHGVMRLNIPDGQQDYYIDGIIKMGTPEKGASSMDTGLKDRYRKPIDAVVRAARLKLALDEAVEQYVASEICVEKAEELRKHIEIVEKDFHYKAMEKNLVACKNYVTKMDAFNNMRIAMDNGKPFRRRTDEKAFAAFKELVKANNQANKYARADSDFATDEQRSAREEWIMNSKELERSMHLSMQTHFKHETSMAIKKEDVVEAVKILKPLVEELKKADMLFPTEKKNADQALQDKYKDAKTTFDALLCKGKAKINAQEEASEKTEAAWQEVITELKDQLKTCKALLPETKDHFDKTDKLINQIKAWMKFDPAYREATTLAPQYVKYTEAVQDAEEKARVEAEEAEAEKDAAEDDEEDDSDDADKSKKKKKKAKVLSKPKKKVEPELPDGVDKIKDRDVKKVTKKLRIGLDAVKCAKMKEEYTWMEERVEEAEERGKELGGLPPSQGCPSKKSQSNLEVTGGEGEEKKKGGNWFTNFWSSIFGSALPSSRPAILTCVLLGTLWSFDT